MTSHVRANDEIRNVTLERHISRHAEGSCLVKFGDTHVMVCASIEERVPIWMKGSGKGWVTAEYSMLPRATHSRARREAATGKQSGRTLEIQRLIGRSMRSIIDLEKLGEKQIIIDCDVLQADGGTRTASITGAWVALYDCISWMLSRNMIPDNPIIDNVAAISCGICNGKHVLDLDYASDSSAEVDMNIVMTGKKQLVEIQGTAEGKPFSEEDLSSLLSLARTGIDQLVSLQNLAVM